MFRTDEVVVKRVARIGFGAVLIAGAVLLVARYWLFPDQHAAAPILVGSWLAAFATYRSLAWRTPTPHAAGDLARAGLVVPAIGILLMLPLLLHLPFVLIMSDARGFEEWVFFSYVFTTLTTVVTGILIGLRTNALVTGRTPGWWLSSAGIYVTGIIAACVPFVILVLPPALVALTGLPFLGLLHYQATLAASERNPIASIPRAFARA